MKIIILILDSADFDCLLVRNNCFSNFQHGQIDYIDFLLNHFMKLIPHQHIN